MSSSAADTLCAPYPFALSPPPSFLGVRNCTCLIGLPGPSSTSLSSSSWPPGGESVDLHALLGLSGGASPSSSLMGSKLLNGARGRE